ncbi:uncharacterized protein B0P05DRAFT_531802 [Gilbertella persicaria]|uniref:uncharacterized protein n=1 Tax=Gilbertella persicaria TaxID=101096 RepID=UPI00221EA66C|nr:uncharacterized protein B0P05DRAFT_531802 [Gilbertella persicaria]KAI8087655.1 hypothetical protein B0P05DRAFT_531802 [Gilbertella persicaria]
MNYVKGKIAENLHVPELVDTVRAHGTKYFYSYSKQYPYMRQTLPTNNMTDSKRKKLLKKIERISHWLDNAVPHSPIPLGLDSILGFIPVIGGSMGGLFALYQVYLSTTFGIPLWLFMHMILNIMIDFVFSLIPILGGFLHMFYKANIYNYEELRDYLDSPEYLERAQLRERKTAQDDIAPGEITWTQLGKDIKGYLPIDSITQATKRSNSFKK